MIDRENVISHFQDAIQDAIEARGIGHKWRVVRVDIIEDALELLKEQEAVKPQLSISGMWYECPVCNRHLTKGRDNYCARCGRPVKWDETE